MMAATLDQTDIAALRNFAIEYGPKWKEALGLDWYNARLSSCREMPERGSILHGLRNNLGPSWLDAYAFDAPIAFPNLRKMKANDLYATLQRLHRDIAANTEEDNILLWAARRERRRRASR